MRSLLLFTIWLASWNAGLSRAAAAAPFGFVPCSMESVIQGRRSAELQRLYREDQADYRSEMADHPSRPLDVRKLEQMGIHDLRRRKRVGEILGEGCFHLAADYSAAAMIFQHGNAPDHFFQAFLWAKQAVALGDERKTGEVALAIDRYLVSIGHRQLFGSQLFRKAESACYCLQPTEDSFPDAIRQKYLPPGTYGLPFLQAYNGTNVCPEPYCPTALAPSPAGTVIGFW